MAQNNKKIEKVIKSAVKEVLGKLGFEIEPEILLRTSFFSHKVKASEDNCVSVKIAGGDLGILIGFKGEILSSLQLILNHVVNKKLKDSFPDLELSKWWYLNLDVGGWKQEREEALIEMAERTVRKALETKKVVPLPPMNASERRVIHIYLSSREEVIQESEGEEPNRRIVVKPR